MGNCLKSASSDDLTLLNGRAGDVRQDSVDEDRNIIVSDLLIGAERENFQFFSPIPLFWVVATEFFSSWICFAHSKWIC